MIKVVELDKNNISVFYKKMFLYKLMSSFGKTIVVSYNKKTYSGNEKRVPEEIEMVVNTVRILNTRGRRKKYELLYDLSCDYLDNEFSCKKLCDFKDDMCVRNRCRTRGVKVSSCCERNKTRVICEHFDNVNKCCKIKSIGCKLFCCYYLRKRGIRYRVNDIPYLKYFLSVRQKLICRTSIFVDKDYVIDKFMKFYKMP